MSAIPANLANDLDTAFGKALYSAGGWAQGLGLPFSLSSLLNLIEGGGSVGGPFTSLSVGPGNSVFGYTQQNQITIAGAATTVDPSITVSGDTNRSLLISTPGTGGIDLQAGTNPPIFLGWFDPSVPGAGTAYNTLYLNQSSATGNVSNYTLLSSGTYTFLNATTALQLAISNSSQMVITPGQVGLIGSILAQTTASTPLTLTGNAAATGVATVLNNQTTLTAGGLVTSFRNNGTEVINVDYLGNLNFASTGTSSIS